MKKILIFGGTPSQGGIETFILNVCKIFSNNSNIFLYNFSESPLAYQNIFIEKYNIKIFNVINNGGLFGHIYRKKQYTDFFKVNHFDYVHVNANSPSNYDFAKAALKSGARVIYHSHNAEAESSIISKKHRYLMNYVRNIQREKLANLDLIRVAVSDQAAKWMFGKTDNITIIPNGVDFENNKFSINKRLDGRNQLNIGYDDKVLIAASRLTTQKNFPKVLTIARNAIEREIIDHLIIVGDGDEKNNIREAISKFPKFVQDRIQLLGAQKDMQKWYSVADLLIMPSLYEGLPYSILEAQANGLHCIVSEAIPTQAVINKQLVHFNDIEDTDSCWTDMLSIAVANDKERHDAYYIAEKSEYSLAFFSKYILNLYEK
ncbi:glycosyltransferase [Leuconostoc mesenteroides]|uniref:glycosyltransferase n=1 Tax=Leuconostoc mesenteroides TaxID=1245 RepID=UPI0032DE5366